MESVDPVLQQSYKKSQLNEKIFIASLALGTVTIAEGAALLLTHAPLWSVLLTGAGFAATSVSATISYFRARFSDEDAGSEHWRLIHNSFNRHGKLRTTYDPKGGMKLPTPPLDQLPDAKKDVGKPITLN